MSDKYKLSGDEITSIKLRAVKYYQEINQKKYRLNKKPLAQGYDNFLAVCYILALSDHLKSKGIIEEALTIGWE